MKEDKLKQTSKTYFDRVASDDFVIPEPVLCYAEVMRLLKEKPFESLADISCGTGNMLKEIIDTFGTEKTLYGVDLSPKSAEKAREKTSGHAEIIVGDVDNIPMDRSKVDIALNMHSFHHYPNPLLALREINRILKPGGRLILVENDYPTAQRIKINLTQFFNGYKNGDIKMYSDGELRKLLESADFEILNRESIADHSQMFVCRVR